jgi:hypothetical protein
MSHKGFGGDGAGGGGNGALSGIVFAAGARVAATGVSTFGTACAGAAGGFAASERRGGGAGGGGITISTTLSGGIGDNVADCQSSPISTPLTTTTAKAQ